MHKAAPLEKEAKRLRITTYRMTARDLVVSPLLTAETITINPQVSYCKWAIDI